MSLHAHIPRPLQRLLNFVAYQATWFTGVYGGDKWTIPAVTCLMLIHLLIVREGEWKLMGCFAITGICMDTIWMHMGLVHYPENTMYPLLPIWLMLLWFAVSTTLTHAINPIFRRPILVTILAVLIAPYSYSVGAKAGGIEITEVGYYAVAAGWGTLMFITSFTIKYIRPDMVGLEH